MSVANGRTSGLSPSNFNVTDLELLRYYLGIHNIPCTICSPFRDDRNPSFSLFYLQDKIYYKDFGTEESGDIYALIGLVLNKRYTDVIHQIEEDLPKIIEGDQLYKTAVYSKSAKSVDDSSQVEIRITPRKAEDYDYTYWESYGISVPFLEMAEVYPISFYYIIYEDNDYAIPYEADKYAYAYVERKEDIETYKIYQPYNREGHKWTTNHDHSVISLWTKVPKYGKHIIICSSLKDALCLWEHTGIPCIAPQGEGYMISKTAITNLRDRYEHIYVMYDNDKAGVSDSKKLANRLDINRIQLPYFYGGKDVSDLAKVRGKDFHRIINKIIFSQLKN